MITTIFSRNNTADKTVHPQFQDLDWLLKVLDEQTYRTEVSGGVVIEALTKKES